VITCEDVDVVLRSGDTHVTALKGIDLSISAGESVVVWGRSGSGKSTLLHALGGLVEPTSGVVRWHGAPLGAIGSNGPGHGHAPGIASIFQSANLLPHLTVFENVAFAAYAAGKANGQATSDTTRGPDALADPIQLLRLVGLEQKAEALPDELSGGEAQRVAIARALAERPQLLLADEPTGHLDSDTGERVLSLMEALQREFGFALVIATHDPDVASRIGREIELDDGRIVRQEVHA
jgi:ABC-type lipoprotein export system ATPase subunit